MRASRARKAAAHRPQIVGVIASAGDLRRAARLRKLPDLFELRLDALADSEETQQAFAKLRAPVILTVRHPREGGHNNLPTVKRRTLLLRHLPIARYVDVELRSAGPLTPVLDEAARLGGKLIISVHDFGATPCLAQITALGRRARAAGADVFKLVTRVDSPDDLETLIAAFEILQRELPVSAMAVGTLARAARRELIARGSVLNYAHLGTAIAPGQFSLGELRRLCGSS